MSEQSCQPTVFILPVAFLDANPTYPLDPSTTPTKEGAIVAGRAEVGAFGIGYMAGLEESH
jgi:hypothetical protein